MSHNTRELTPRSTLAALRLQAKRWLKEIESGDEPALARFNTLVPNHSGTPRLREVQQALAREYGFASWAALKQELGDREIAARGHTERVALFLEKSALRYGVAPATQSWGDYEADRPARGALALRILTRHPAIATDSIHTAVAAHDVEAVRRLLASDPALARKPGGPDNWTPLLRLAHTRLPSEAAAQNGLAIAVLLLDRGASANDYWSDGQNHFTVLTGIIGGGESSQPAHPQAEALARLLIQRGADPLDGQALYNSSLGADETIWLEFLWNQTAARGQDSRWRERLRELPGPPLDYLLGNAVPQQPKRAAWLLAHGAKADSINAYTKRSLIKQALLDGRDDLVALLKNGGATMPELSPREAFIAAVARGDEAEARRFARDVPDALTNPATLNASIRQNRPDIAVLALKLGVDPNAATHDGVRPLHEAAGAGATRIARLLVEAGAEVDPVERRFGSTPLGWAHHNGKTEAQAYLTGLSSDVCGLCRAAELDRLEVLFAENPALAREPTRAGEPPLFALPDEDDDAVDVSGLLLAAGADARARNRDGLTTAEVARKRGLFDTAALLQPPR